MGVAYAKDQVGPLPRPRVVRGALPTDMHFERRQRRLLLAQDREDVHLSRALTVSTQGAPQRDKRAARTDAHAPRPIRSMCIGLTPVPSLFPYAHAHTHAQSGRVPARCVDAGGVGGPKWRTADRCRPSRQS
jgi:hypothetical protein